MIHVCFGLHDGDGKYSKFIGAAMASIFVNTAALVTIHILHDATLTADNRQKFSELADKYNQYVDFHDTEKICPNEINLLREKLADKINSRFSIGMFYRLLIKKILGAGKAIYLDADIIVNLDIAELWQQDMKNFPVAAVPEIDATNRYMIIDKFLLKSGRVNVTDYFCSGVMILNLDALDENFFNDGVKFLVDNPQCESPDQDILNAFFAENYLKLEQKFDAFANINRRLNLPVTQKIYHYAGHKLGLDLDDAYNRLFAENFSRTPWFNVEVLNHLSKEFRLRNELYCLQTQLIMGYCAKHCRAFFVEPHNVEPLKKFFAIQDDEPIIEIRNQNSVRELIDRMTQWRGQKIFFIIYPDWPRLKNLLTTCGFEEYADYVNGLTLLTQEQGGTYSDRQFVRGL